MFGYIVIISMGAVVGREPALPQSVLILIVSYFPRNRRKEMMKVPRAAPGQAVPISKRVNGMTGKRIVPCCGCTRRQIFVALALLVMGNVPVLAQTCDSPLPLLMPLWGGTTEGTTCGAGDHFPMTPHPVVVHSFWAGPQVAGTLSFSSGFPDAELLLIDGRDGTPPCGDGTAILGIVTPGQSLTLTGLPYGQYFLAITSFQPSSEPVSCGEYVIGHWLWEVEEIFDNSFENA